MKATRRVSETRINAALFGEVCVILDKAKKGEISKETAEFAIKAIYYASQTICEFFPEYKNALKELETI